MSTSWWHGAEPLTHELVAQWQADADELTRHLERGQELAEALAKTRNPADTRLRTAIETAPVGTQPSGPVCGYEATV